MAAAMMSKDMELRARVGKGFSVYKSSARHSQLRIARWTLPVHRGLYRELVLAV